MEYLHFVKYIEDDIEHHKLFHITTNYSLDFSEVKKARFSSKPIKEPSLSKVCLVN